SVPMPTRFCQVQDPARDERHRASRPYLDPEPAGRPFEARRPAGLAGRSLADGRSKRGRWLAHGDSQWGAAYAVCVQCWLLVGFCLGVVVVVTLLFGAHESAARLTGLVLWALFGGALLTAALRFWTVR